MTLLDRGLVSMGYGPRQLTHSWSSAVDQAGLVARLDASRPCVDAGEPDAFKLVRAGAPRAAAHDIVITSAPAPQPFLLERRRAAASRAAAQRAIAMDNELLLEKFRWIMSHKRMDNVAVGHQETIARLHAQREKHAVATVERVAADNASLASRVHAVRSQYDRRVLAKVAARADAAPGGPLEREVRARALS